MTAFMNEEQKVMANIMRKIKPVESCFRTLDGVTLDSLEVEGIRAPDLDFFGAKSFIEIPVKLNLNFNNEYKAGVFVVFKTKEQVASLDKSIASDVIKTSEFWCDYEMDDDEWEFSDNLSVIITTKDDELISAIHNYDSCLVVMNNPKDDGTTDLYAQEILAGMITEYFSCYIGATGEFSEHTQRNNKQVVDPTLRHEIIASLRKEVAALLV